MTDTKLLESVIERSGCSREEIAEALGITPRALDDRIENRVQFSYSEINALCDFLTIESLSERSRIFYSGQ